MASADTLSPVYPDRPIRPLPKNRLKSRLSPEQSAGLIYPPDPPISSISLNFPFGASDKDKGEDARLANGHGPGVGTVVTHCTCGAEHGDESDSEEIIYDHPNFRVQSPTEGAHQRRVAAGEQNARTPSEPGAAAAGVGMRAVGKFPAAPASIASSADGYESFENTSNKKKRKIPLSASSAVHQSAMTAAHQSTLTAELANMGIGSQDGVQDDVPLSSAYAANSTGMGPAGAGRGRASKSSPMRRRERVSMSHLTNGHLHPTERSVERGGAYKGDGTRITQEHNIISTAIANAQTQSPATPHKGRENISLLSHPESKSATPKTQFTFTCESDSANKMVWPIHSQPLHSTPTPTSHQQYYPSTQPTSHSDNPMASHATQTSMRGGSTAFSGPPTNAPPPRKPRPRRPSREYALAARRRRLEQEYANFHHKPNKDNMWICEFCEYEDIWGVPPAALIRQYEIKDRAERKKAEEKRRLLEKAKTKGRRGKKAKSKNTGNSNSGVAAGGTGAGVAHGYEHGEHGQDEYYDDDYDDGYPDHHHHDHGGGEHHHEQPLNTPAAPHRFHGPPPPPPPPPEVTGSAPR